MTAYEPLGLATVTTGSEVDFDALLRRLEAWERNVGAILNRGISFSDNMDARIITVTSHGTPGTEAATSHTLGKVPTGYVLIGQGGAGSVYDGATANTKTTLYLKSDVASTAFTILVF